MVDKEYLIFTKKYIDIDLRDRILLSKNESIYDNLLLIFKNQISHASELNNLIKDLIFNNFSIDFIDNFIVEIGKDIFYKNMISLKNELNKYDEINFENASKIIDDVKKNTNLKGKELYMPIRMIAICKEHSPELNKVLTFIGKDKIISNIKNIEEKIFKK
jgi:glutamyl/glutaminyl-tRNA synthetase